MYYEVSDVLKAQLTTKEMRGATTGIVKPNMMKWANDLIDREEDGDEVHSPSGGEGRPNALPRLRIYRARPFLAVLDGGLLD